MNTYGETNTPETATIPIEKYIAYEVRTGRIIAEGGSELDVIMQAARVCPELKSYEIDTERASQSLVDAWIRNSNVGWGIDDTVEGLAVPHYEIN